MKGGFIYLKGSSKRSGKGKRSIKRSGKGKKKYTMKYRKKSKNKRLFFKY